MAILSPSILSADFANLGQAIITIKNAGAQLVHIDVMDGHFVPNLTIGAPVVKDLRKVSDITFDVHLMIENPCDYLDDFIKAGADIITVHYEANGDTAEQIKKIKAAGLKAGVSVKPKTDVSVLYPFLDQLDLALVMSVEPGFGGQSFIEESLDKISQLRREIDKLGVNCSIEVDGGINLKNAKDVISAGANILVAGSAVFCASDPKAAVREFCAL